MMRYISWTLLLLVTVYGGFLISVKTFSITTYSPTNSAIQPAERRTQIQTTKTHTNRSITIKGVWNEWNTGDVFNHELEYYSPKAVTFKGQGLVITASKEKMGTKNFVSGRIDEKKHAFKYGVLVASMKLPSGTGMFPALWLRPANGNIFPEVDVMENIGREPGMIVPAYHETSGGDIYTRYSLRTPTQFHTYKLVWQPHLLEWSIDGHVILKVTKNVPHQPMYVTVNLAIGGTWPHNPTNRTKFPQRLILKRLVISPNKGPSLVGNRLVRKVPSS